MKEMELKVNGMACTGCENGIKNALQNISGVEKVEANHQTCQVKVTLNGDVTREKIEEVITDLGYEVVKEN